MIEKLSCHFSKKSTRLRSVGLWESFTFVTSRIQCKKKVDFEIQVHSVSITAPYRQSYEVSSTLSTFT